MDYCIHLPENPGLYGLLYSFTLKPRAVWTTVFIYPKTPSCMDYCIHTFCNVTV
jgi:hypothetical protein